MNENLAKKDSDKKCNARKKNTPGYCSLIAGFRTDHKGTGRCWVHGGRGNMPRGTELYQKVLSPKIQDIKDIFEEVSELDPTDIDKLDAAIKLIHATMLSTINSGKFVSSQLQGYTNSLEKLIRTKVEIEKGLRQRVPNEDKDHIVRTIMLAIGTVLKDYPELKEKLSEEIGRLRVKENEEDSETEDKKSSKK